MAIGWPGLPRFARGLALAAAAAAVAAVAIAPDPAALLARGLVFSGLLTAFVAGMNLMREVARTSPLVKACGVQILAQPPGRRYAALSYGAHFFGVIAAYGVVNLLAVMILRANTPAAAGGNEGVRAIRERRALLAILRGFAFTVLWSPISVPLAIVITAQPGLTWLDVAPFTFAIASVLVALGWAVDAFTWRWVALPAGGAGGDVPRWTVHLRLGAVILVMFALLIAVDAALGRRFIVAAIAALPCFAASWIFAQYLRAGPRRAALLAGRRLGRVVATGIFGQRLELTIIGSAAFLGMVVGGLIDPGVIAAAVGALALPPFAIAIALVWLFFLLGHLGATPIVLTALMAGAIADPAALGLSPLLFAVALISAFGVTQSSSPFTIGVIVIAALARRSPFEVGLVWNRFFNALALATLSLLLVLVWLAVG